MGASSQEDCSVGVVAGSAYCCPLGSVLSNVGECCSPPQKLDACGTCGGTGQAVDFLGTCCQGSLDAGGLCCPQPLAVDQFGVCGGASNSGLLQLTMQAYLPGKLKREAIFTLAEVAHNKNYEVPGMRDWPSCRNYDLDEKKPTLFLACTQP